MVKCDWFLPFVVFYLPHCIFLLYKIGQSLFSPASKVYLYDSVCTDQFDDEPFMLISHSHNGSSRFDWTVHAHHITNATNASQLQDWTQGNYTVVYATCQNLTGPSEDLIQLQAANYIMAMKILQNVPAFLLGMVCGGWIDRVGQRLPMILSCLGGFSVAVAFSIIHATGAIALPGILIGITINSFTGRNTLVTTAIQSYITDRTADAERTRQLGFILAMNFFGLFGGSLLMGVMADTCPFWAMFLVVAVFYGIALALICIFLPAGKPKKEVTTSHELSEADSTSSFNLDMSEDALLIPTGDKKKKTNAVKEFFKTLATCCQLSNFTDTLKTIGRKRPHRLRTYLLLTFLCIILQNMCKSGEIDVLLLFVRHSPLNWKKSAYGYLLTYQYAVVGLMLIFLLPLLLHKFHLSDSVIVMGCTVAKAAGLTFLGFSTETWMVFVANTFVSTFGMIISCLRSIVSKMVDDDETGRCFAIIASAEVVSDLIGVVLFTRLYYVGLTYKSIGISLPFFVMAGIHVVLLILSLVVYIGIRKLPEMNNNNDESDCDSSVDGKQLKSCDGEIAIETTMEPISSTQKVVMESGQSSSSSTVADPLTEK